MSFLAHNETEVDGHRTVAITDAQGYAKIVDQGHPAYAAILSALIEVPQDRAKIEGLIDPHVHIAEQIAGISERVSVDRNGIYIDGVEVTGSAGQAIHARIHSGVSADWGRFVRFLLSLWENPSPKAQEAVWSWVEKHGISITEDGRMVGYKGLVMGRDLDNKHVPTSYHSGPNNFINGRLYGESGVDYQVPHQVGSVISKRRADVDPNDRLACSTGLHVGGYSYAKTFGENRADGQRYSTMGKMASTFALVAFAAENVVSVPEDGTSDWKIRVTEYEVLEFLNEVDDVLKGQIDYAPAKVEVPVETPAPFVPAIPVEVEEVEDTLDDSEVEDEDGGVEVEVEDEDPVVRYDIVEHTGSYFGDVVVEAFSDEASAQEALEEVWETDNPEGDYEIVPVYQSDLEADEIEKTDEDDEATLVTPDAAKPTLADWVEANPGSSLVSDLNDRNLGHKAIGRKWSEITSEASVRRFRKAAGIKVALATKIRG